MSVLVVLCCVQSKCDSLSGQLQQRTDALAECTANLASAQKALSEQTTAAQATAAAKLGLEQQLSRLTAELKRLRESSDQRQEGQTGQQHAHGTGAQPSDQRNSSASTTNGKPTKAHNALQPNATTVLDLMKKS